MSEPVVTVNQPACPVISSLQLVKDDSLKNVVGAPQYQVTSMIAPCLKQNCMWWSKSAHTCGVVAGLSAISSDVYNLSCVVQVAAETIGARSQHLSHLAHLEPPKEGKSPLARLADAVERLVKVWSDRAEKGGK